MPITQEDMSFITSDGKRFARRSQAVAYENKTELSDFAAWAVDIGRIPLTIARQIEANWTLTPK